jgi:hypothetical protein
MTVRMLTKIGLPVRDFALSSASRMDTSAKLAAQGWHVIEVEDGSNNVSLLFEKKQIYILTILQLAGILEALDKAKSLTGKPIYVVGTILNLDDVPSLCGQFGGGILREARIDVSVNSDSVVVINQDEVVQPEVTSDGNTWQGISNARVSTATDLPS